MPFKPAVRRERKGRVRSRSDAVQDVSFFLYVEGPRDGELLRLWAKRASPAVARPLEQGLVILGGRQPARAVEHFRNARVADPGCRGLVLLDRDHHRVSEDWAEDEPGLEVFTWGRRHIESYVLVRAAIGRSVGPSEDAGWVDRLVATHVPAHDDEQACRDLDAKRLLGSKGALARDLGRAVSPAEVARTMRRDEIHSDVFALFERIRVACGLAEPGLQVVVRARPGR